MKLYKIISLGYAAVFGMVGLVFLLIPNEVLRFFNRLSDCLGLPLAPLHGLGFYLILAAGYMYLVTLLAYLMYRHPANPLFPMLLAHAKLASALLSFYLCWMDEPHLIYLSNGIVDGLIGLTALLFYNQIRKTGAWG